MAEIIASMTPRAWMAMGIVVILSYFLYDRTKKTIMTLVFLLGATTGVGLWTGFLSGGQVMNMTGGVGDSVKRWADEKSAKAKGLGAKFYSTSAGGASEDNKHYKDNIDPGAQ